MGFAGLVAGLAVAGLGARRKGLSVLSVLEVAVATALAAIVGVRLAFVGFNLDALAGGQLGLGDLAHGGMASIGALLGVPVGVWLLRRRRLPVLTVLDIAAVCVPVSLAFARVGCHSAGCCAGPHAEPVQLLSATLMIGLAVGLHLFSLRPGRPGRVMVALAVAYPALRVVLAGIRGDGSGLPYAVLLVVVLGALGFRATTLCATSAS